MKQQFFILIIIFLSEFYACNQRINYNDKENFNKFLGRERSIAMNETIESFDNFIKTNYPNQSNQHNRIKEFLRQYNLLFTLDSSWNFPTKKNKKILERWESSGLRKEIWIYGYEEYDPVNDIHELIGIHILDTANILNVIETDPFEEEIMTAIDTIEIKKHEKETEERYKNSLHINVNGAFLYGLAKFNVNDSVIQGYVKAKVLYGDISPVLILSSLLNQNIDYDNPFIKSILIIEIYYWLMKLDVERSEK